MFLCLCALEISAEMENDEGCILPGRRAYCSFCGNPLTFGCWELDVKLHGVVVTKVQDPALGLVEPHTVGLGPSICSVQIPLQTLPTLEHMDTPTQLGVICKLTEGALNPLVQITDEDVKQHWTQN